MVGAEFDHRVLMLFSQAQQRHRYTDIVVQVASGIQCVAALAKDRRGHLFDRGFTGRAGQGDDAGRYLLTHQAANSPKAWRVSFTITCGRSQASGRLTSSAPAPAAFARFGKIMSVETLAFQRHKQAARRHFTGIGGHLVDSDVATLPFAMGDRGELA